MSISIWVAALREITDSDRELITLYNGLIDRNINPPAELISQLQLILGNDTFYPGEKLPIFDPEPGKTGTVEITVHGEGDVMYGDGMIILMSDLPPNTVALRIYSEA